MSVKKRIIRRITIIYLFLMVAAIAVILRGLFVQFTTDDASLEAYQKSLIREFAVIPHRGDICARDGRVMATSVPYYEIRFDPCSDGIKDSIFNAKVDSLSLCLSKHLGKSITYYRDRIVNAREKGNRYLFIAKGLTYQDLQQFKEFPIFRKGQIEGGFIVKEHKTRELPFGKLARRTIGKMKTDYRSGVGLEDNYNKELAGDTGHTTKQRKPKSGWVPVSSNKLIEPKDGYDLITSIDIRVQDVAETALEDQMHKHDAQQGTAVVMEVQTGFILAIANLDKGSDGKYYEMANHAVNKRTEPGSTFKLASIMVALEAGYISLEDSVDTGSGKAFFRGVEMNDHDEGGYGKINIRRAFEVSSNIGIAKTIDNYFYKNPNAFIDRLHNFGLGDKVNPPIKGEAAPKIRIPDKQKDKAWSDISIPWMSIGHENQFTPLQLLCFYNAVANGGERVRPLLVNAFRDKSDIITECEKEVVNSSICSKQTIEKAVGLLKGVVERGTAQNIRSDKYGIAGKTGTARIGIYTDEEGGRHKKYIASFVGFFPADKPKYSCIISVYEPRRNGIYGGQVAAPVFKKIADKLHAIDPDLHPRYDMPDPETNLPLAIVSDRNRMDAALSRLEIPHDERSLGGCKWVDPTRKDAKVKYYVRTITNDLRVPNVKGMGLSDAVRILENCGLNIEVSGRGVVRKQSLPPESRYTKGQTIKIVLG